MSFWRLEGCGRVVGGDFARDWLRFGAKKLRRKQVLVEWHQFWCRLQRANRAAASKLMPQKSFFSVRLNFSGFPWSTPWGGFQKISKAHIKTAVPIPYLVRGYIEKWRLQENFSPSLNYSPFPWSTTWERKNFLRHPQKRPPELTS